MALSLDKQRNRINEAYLHYPNIPSGYLGIKVRPEGIKSFNILKNNRDIRIPLQYKFIGSEKIYRIYITGFEYTTESPYTVDKIVISAKNTQTDRQYEIFYKDTITEIENDEPVIKSTIKSGEYKFEMNSTTEWKEEYIQDESGICVGDFGYTAGDKYKDIIESEDNYTQHIISSEAPGVFTLEGIHDSWDANFHTGLCFFELKDTNNVWVKITVDYYSEYGKLGTYELVYNPYLNDEVGILGECKLVSTAEQTQYYTHSREDLDEETGYLKPRIVLDAIEDNSEFLQLELDGIDQVLPFQKNEDPTKVIPNIEGLGNINYEFVAGAYTSGSGLDHSGIKYESYQITPDIIYNKTRYTNELSTNGSVPSGYYYMGKSTIIEHGSDNSYYSYINDIEKFVTRYNKDFRKYNAFANPNRKGYYANYNPFRNIPGQIIHTHDEVNGRVKGYDQNNQNYYLYKYLGLPSWIEGISLKIKDYSYLNSKSYSLSFVFFSHDDDGHGCIFSDQVSEYFIANVPALYYSELGMSDSGHSQDYYVMTPSHYTDLEYTRNFESGDHGLANNNGSPYNHILRHLNEIGYENVVAYEGWGNNYSLSSVDSDHLAGASSSTTVTAGHGGRIFDGEYDANGQLIGDSGIREYGHFISDYLERVGSESHYPKVTARVFGFDKEGRQYNGDQFETLDWDPGISASHNYFGGNKYINYFYNPGGILQDVYHVKGDRYAFPQNQIPALYINPHPRQDEFTLIWEFSSGIKEYYNDPDKDGYYIVGLDIPSGLIPWNKSKTETITRDYGSDGVFYNCYIYNTYPDQARTVIRLFHNYKLILNTTSNLDDDFINRFPNKGGKLVLQTDLRWKYDADDGSTRYAKAGINGREDVTVSNLLINSDDYSGELSPKNFILNYDNHPDITDSDYSVRNLSEKYIFDRYIDKDGNAWNDEFNGNYKYISSSSIQMKNFQEYIPVKNGYRFIKTSNDVDNKLLGPAIYVFNINALNVKSDAKILLKFRTFDNEPIVKETTLVKLNYIKNKDLDDISSIISKEESPILVDTEKDNYFLPVVFCVKDTIYLEEIEFKSDSAEETDEKIVCNLINFGVYQINITEFNTIEKENCKKLINETTSPIKFLDRDWDFRNYVVLQSVVNVREIDVPVLTKTFKLRYLPQYSYQIPLFRKYINNDNEEIAIYTCDINSNVVEFQNNTNYTYEIDYIKDFTSDAKIKIKS